MLRRASLRESSLPALLEAIKGHQRGTGRRPDGMRVPREMMRTLIPPSSIAITVVGIIAVAALVMSTWQLAHSSGARPSTVTVRAGGVAATTGALTEQAPEATPSPPAKPRATLAKLVLTAVRGDCWLEVRASYNAGKILFAGTLEQGRSLRFAKRRLWLAFGAGSNLDVTLNGQRVESFPTGTATVVVTAKGVSGPLAT